MTRFRFYIVYIAIGFFVILAIPFSGFCQETDWKVIEPGLELGQFRSPTAVNAKNPDISILRVDPHIWTLQILTAAQLEDNHNRTMRTWCEEFDLIAAINAGMYQSDFQTSVGYMRCAGKVLNSAVNKYQSVAAFDPLLEGLPPFRIFDLDEVSFSELKQQYGTLIQNLRLVKRAGENRWSQSKRRWPEAALGEDGLGRALFIYCATSLTMFDLIEVLLGLPIDLVCAQHLEGGAEAQLFLNHPDLQREFCGGDNRLINWPVPNAIGIVAGLN